MGGGGGRGPTKHDLSRLESLARETLRQGDKGKKHNVFISFDHDDINDVNLLRGQAKNENSDIEFNDWSLREPFDSEKAEYIKKGIRDRIKQSSLTMVFVSDKTAKSKWVDWEVQESIRLGKGVLVVYKGDSPPDKLPNALREHKNKVVLTRWTHRGIADAIVKADKKREGEK